MLAAGSVTLLGTCILLQRRNNELVLGVSCLDDCVWRWGLFQCIAFVVTFEHICDQAALTSGPR